MRFPFRLVPDQTHIQFMRLRQITFGISIILMIASAVFFLSRGLNLGIDFRGGVKIEIKTVGAADIGAIRAQLASLDLGDVQVQEFGAQDTVLIRIERQPGDDNAQQQVIQKVRGVLNSNVEYRQVEMVGPRISEELTRNGIIGVLVALLAVLAYIWFRFEWQFAIGALAALLHDVILTIGMYSVVGLEFNLSSIAALLTIVGYSLNDTVVVYDRVRENLRKYKKQALSKVLDRSVNDTLSRTVLTSVTTLLALVILYIFGGTVIQSFTFAMIFGILVGTYSSVFIAAALLLFFKMRPNIAKEEPEASAKI